MAWSELFIMTNIIICFIEGLSYNNGMIYLIYGSERYLMDRCLDQLKTKYQINLDLMNLSIYDLENDSMKAVYDDLLIPPFFSEYKMVLVNNPLFLTTKKTKKNNVEDVAYLEKWLEQDNKNTILVFFYHKNNIEKADKIFDKRKTVYKKLMKQAKVYPFEKLNYYKLADYTRQEVRKKQAVIDDDALDLLIARTNENLLDVYNEIEKLTLYTKQIRYRDVDCLVPKPLNEKVFDLSNALLAHNQIKTFEIYHDLMILKEEPIKLLVIIADNLRLIYQIRFLDRKGYNDREIGQLLKVNPFRLKYLRKGAENLTLEDILALLDKLSQLDIDIKRGRIDKKLGLELFLMGLGNG